MLKKIIKHNDFDGNPTETTCYFNLTKAEAIELNIRTDLEVVGQSKDQNEIMDAWRRILKMAYGRKLANGDFVKEGFAAFAAGEAYSEMFMQIWQDAEYGSEFIKGILPASIIEAEGQQTSQSNIPAHMANHPSMQSHRAKQPSEREQFTVPGARSDSVVTPRETGPTLAQRQDAALADSQTTLLPEGFDDAQYQQFLAYQASLRPAQTPPERVSPPEAPQQSTDPRAELI